LAHIGIARPYAADIVKAVRRNELVEHAAFWLYLGGLAWVPFWYASNDLIAWGINALMFPGLAAFYEVSLIIRARPHPVGIRHIAVPATLFAAVLGWIALQTCSWVPSALTNPIWGMAQDALGGEVAGSIASTAI